MINSSEYEASKIKTYFISGVEYVSTQEIKNTYPLHLSKQMYNFLIDESAFALFHEIGLMIEKRHFEKFIEKIGGFTNYAPLH